MATSSTSRVTDTQGARTVTALMVVAVLFALISHEIKVGQTKGATVNNGVTAGGRIILGGFVATTALVLLTHAGDAGRQLGVGLAVVTFATVTLTEGKPVWTAISNAVGGTTTGTTPSAGTAPSSPSTPSANTTAAGVTIATSAL